jgi:hypothetical protein
MGPIGFPGSGTKSKTGEWLKPALPLAFNTSQKKFGRICPKNRMSRGRKDDFRRKQLNRLQIKVGPKMKFSYVQAAILE